MKRLLTFLALVLFSFSAVAQVKSDSSYTPPQFLIGKNAFHNYISNNINYPLPEREIGIYGDVNATIFIDSTGNIKNVTATGKYKALNKAVKEALISMPAWSPAKLNGRAIDTSITQIIYFSIDKTRKINDDPAIVEIIAYKVTLIDNGKFYKENIEQLSKAEKAREIYEGGVQALKNKQFTAAVDSFNKASANGFNTVDLLYNKGVAYINLGNKEEACINWRAAAERGDAKAFKVYNSICLKQNNPSQIDSDAVEQPPYTGEIFTWVQDMPKFPGADQGLLEYIQHHINYNAVDLSIKGKVYVRFAVDDSGNVRNASIPKGMGIGGGCDEEALRTVKALPPWTPGKQNGHAVAVWMTVPVQFGNYKILSADSSEKNDSIPEDHSFMTKTDSNQVYTHVQQMPQFPGGDYALLVYVQRHINYPAEARRNGIQGRVIIRFIIDQNGIVKNVSVPDGMGIGGGCDEEAIRMAMSLPQWIPGKQDGKPVSVWFTVPVIFRLQ